MNDPVVAPPYLPTHPGGPAGGGTGSTSGAGRRSDQPSNHPDYGDPSYRVSERQRAEFRDKHPSSESYRRELDETRRRLPEHVDVSPEELDAINRQMGGAHQDVNTALRNRDTEALAEHDSLIRHTVSGLNRFPAFKGEVHRGIQIDRGDLDAFLERYRAGRTVKDPAFVSADKSRGYPGNVQMHIKSRHGKDISSVRPYGNQEVAWGPDNNFEVTSPPRHDPDTDTWHIELTDRGPGPLEDTAGPRVDSGTDTPAPATRPDTPRTGDGSGGHRPAAQEGAGGYVGDISARLDGDPAPHSTPASDQSGPSPDQPVTDPGDSEIARRLAGEDPGTPAGQATIDPSVEDIRPSEQATVARLAERPEFAGRRFSASQHEHADFVDDQGTTYDAMGDGSKAEYFNERKFLKSIDHHVNKQNDYTVLDMTGYDRRHIDAVERHLAAMPAGKRDRIIKVGF